MNRRRQPARTFRTPLPVEQLVDSPTTDPLGPVEIDDAANWEPYTTIRAHIETDRTRFLRSGEGSALIDYEITCRYDSVAAAITPAMRVIYNGRPLNIKAAYAHNEARRRGRYWVIEAAEVV